MCVCVCDVYDNWIFLAMLSRLIAFVHRNRTRHWNIIQRICKESREECERMPFAVKVIYCRQIKWIISTRTHTNSWEITFQPTLLCLWCLCRRGESPTSETGPQTNESRTAPTTWPPCKSNSTWPIWFCASRYPTCYHQLLRLQPQLGAEAIFGNAVGRWSIVNSFRLTVTKPSIGMQSHFKDPINASLAALQDHY